MNTKILLALIFLLSATCLKAQVTSCLTNDVDGYASLSGEGLGTTTGGKGGTVVNISSLSQLEDWVSSREDNSSPEIVYINGLIEQPGTSSMVLTIKRGGNISIIGNTYDAGLKNIGLNFREYTNVIVRNLTVREVFYPNDGITIDECHHVWIDHCDLYSKNGPGIGVDTYDGLLDVKNGSHNVTISWNKLHSHKKVNLLGHTDNSSAQSIDKNIRVTFHHNYYYDNDGRNPSLRWGAAHVYNNYYKDIYDYGIAVRQGAHALIENNIYENVITPISTNKFTGEGYACERGNVFTGCGPNSITQTECSWWNSSTLPYNYSLTPTDNLIALLTTKTGTCSSSTVTDLQTKNTLGLFNGVFPNPTNRSFTVKADRPVKSISIVDLFGKLLEEQSTIVVREDIEVGADLPEGTYMLMVEYFSGEREAVKIVKVK
ncbi:T9SS type A sorting domain-containing protein [Sporocytophaga myxococcoides]|uniref:pectate lyase family protein n=1 Tax=Sporocytophaga myxococcoides TaxID=153721 RepID=UPI00040BDF41|nr:T9SS type A sorting domain-containing protein [Sporocytophaga myxococcoides]